MRTLVLYRTSFRSAARSPARPPCIAVSNSSHIGRVRPHRRRSARVRVPLPGPQLLHTYRGFGTGWDISSCKSCVDAGKGDSFDSRATGRQRRTRGPTSCSRSQGRVSSGGACL